MKQLINFDPVFDPTAKTLDFRFYPDFQADLLYGVINVTRNQIIYAPGTTTYGGTWSGTTLTLTFDTSSYATSDILNVYYETASPRSNTLFVNTPLERGGMLESQQNLLHQILTELKVQNYLLQQAFYPMIKDDLDRLRKDVEDPDNPDASENAGLS